MKSVEVPKKIYKLQVETIKLAEEIYNAKIEKKDYSDKILIEINNETIDGKKKFKNQIERNIEFSRRVLSDSDYLKLEDNIRLSDIRLKKLRYFIDYYNNMLKILPYSEVEIEELEHE